MHHQGVRFTQLITVQFSYNHISCPFNPKLNQYKLAYNQRPKCTHILKMPYEYFSSDNFLFLGHEPDYEQNIWH